MPILEINWNSASLIKLSSFLEMSRGAIIIVTLSTEEQFDFIAAYISSTASFNSVQTSTNLLQ